MSQKGRVIDLYKSSRKALNVATYGKLCNWKKYNYQVRLIGIVAGCSIPGMLHLLQSRMVWVLRFWAMACLGENQLPNSKPFSEIGIDKDILVAIFTTNAPVHDIKFGLYINNHQEHDATETLMLHLGKDWPQGYDYFKIRLKKAFMKNKELSDPEQIEKCIKHGEFVKKEIETLYMLKKYRTLKRRYTPS